MNVPLLDLAAEYRSIQGEIDSAVAAVLASGKYVLGPNVTAFEADIASLLGVRHAVGVASGTDALIIALRAAGVQPGDEVIIPAYSFFATASAVMLVGARPVFVDIESTTHLIDPRAIEKVVSPRTRALIPVHLFGHPADMDSLDRIAASRNLALIEDNAQAVGAQYHGRVTGSWGRASALSFYPGKNLGAAGDAGLVATNDEAVAGAARMLRSHGWKQKYYPEILGYNSRLDELQAAILRVKFLHLKAWTMRRREIAQHYSEQLADTGLLLPVEAPGCVHVYYRYIVGVPRREEIIRRLEAAGISTEVYFPQALHLAPACRALGGREGDFPIAEAASRNLLALPLYPQLSDAQVEHVLAEVRRAVRSASS